MAESDFTQEQLYELRARAQQSARMRAQHDFRPEAWESEEFNLVYERTWRQSYADYIGEQRNAVCPCCGRAN